MPGGATVQPARLALGLRAAVLARGVAIFERTRARRIGPEPGGGIVVETDAGARVRAPAAVLAINAATAGLRPLRVALAVSSTHMILTEPVPDVLAELGWTGGEAISTARRYLHYFRTTEDGRIAFGGGGRLAYGARLGGRIEVDAGVVEELRSEIARFFPGLRGRRIEAAWGGPVDVSPTHLPSVGSLAGDRIHYVCGFTGNGVGPAHLTGRMLADARARPSRRAHPARAGRAGPAAGAARAAALPRRQRRAGGAAAQGGAARTRAARRDARRAGARGPATARDPSRTLAADRRNLVPA